MPRPSGPACYPGTGEHEVCFLPACLHGGGTRVLTQADADYYSHNGIGKSQIQLPE